MAGTETRSVFRRAAVPITITTADGERTVLCHRVTFRHAQPWLDAWFEWAQAAETGDTARFTVLALRLVKAGLPEPDPDCSPSCPCAGNAGLHAEIDLLDGEDFNALFEGVLDVNRPKGSPPMSPAAVGLTPRKRWPVSYLLDFARKTRSTFL